jgi:rubrerythrin
MEQFNIVDDILDFAIGNEIEAHKFYTGLAAKMPDKTMKQVFLDFAEEELGHRKLLEDAKANKKVLLKKEQMADLKIAEFTVPVAPTPNMNFKDALILAMQKEKKAFVLYTRLANLMHNKDNAELFAALAQQEAKHKLRFELEYDDVVLKED